MTDNPMQFTDDGRLQLPRSTATDDHDVVTKAELDAAVGGGASGETAPTDARVTDVADHGFDGDRSGGDVAQFIADHTHEWSRDVFVLPNGTYEFGRSLQFVGSGGDFEEGRPHTIAIVGQPEATLHVDIGPDEDFRDRICFVFGNSSTPIPRVRLENLHFDIGDHDGDRDAGIMTARIGEYARFRNLSITGRRRWERGATGGDGEKNGHRHTFALDCVNESAFAEAVDIRLPDGDVYEPGVATVGHAIPISAEHDHVGTTVWRGCHVEGFVDNGFYLRDGPGSNRVYDSTALDNAAGNFRLGRNDYAQGITSKATGDQPFNCTPLWVEEHRDSDPYDVGSEHDDPLVVEGFTLIAAGEPVNDVVRCSNDPTPVVLRDGYIRCGTDDFVIDATHRTGSLTVENVTVDDTASGDVREAAFRLDGDDVTFDNVTYRADPPDGESGRSIIRIRGKRITIADCDLLGSYHPMLEVHAGASYTLRGNTCRHDGSVDEPYVIRHHSDDVEAAWLVDNDLSDYADLVGSGDLDDYEFAEVRGNRGP